MTSCLIAQVMVYLLLHMLPVAVLSLALEAHARLRFALRTDMSAEEVGPFWGCAFRLWHRLLQPLSCFTTAHRQDVHVNDS